ncbi:hypothetical protein T484DRAFT_1841579 [Baffinella frigidus]|nr:hypothetical protein T484DRAFT_1841579 [Cryptophyta sp. CCMP2293]
MALSRAVLLCVVVSCSSLLSPAASPATGSLPPPHMEVCAATAGAALIRGSCRTSGGWGLREGGVVGAAGLGPRLSLRGGGDGKGQGKKGGRLKKGGKKAKYGGRRPRKDGIDSEVSSLLDSESDGSSTSSEPVAKRVKPSAASSSPLALGSTSGGGKAEGKEEKGRRRVQGAGVSLMPEGGEGAGRGEGQKGGRLREDTYGIEADPKMMQLNPMVSA